MYLNAKVKAGGIKIHNISTLEWNILCVRVTLIISIY